jgi:hypothetical protein
VTPPHAPLDKHVAEGAPVKPLLQVAVQTRPTEEVVPQLKTPLVGLTGLFLQVTVVDCC